MKLCTIKIFIYGASIFSIKSLAMKKEKICIYFYIIGKNEPIDIYKQDLIIATAVQIKKPSGTGDSSGVDNLGIN